VVAACTAGDRKAERLKTASAAARSLRIGTPQVGADTCERNFSIDSPETRPLNPWTRANPGC
jgi:hypothetical protein